MEVIEEWRDVPGRPGIKASNLGHIIGKLGQEVGCTTWKYVMCGGRTGIDNGKWTESRGNLVLRTFVGPAPPNKTVDHINGNKHDDRLANLRWFSKTEQNLNRPLMGHSSTKIKGLYLLKATLPNHSDRWRCTVTVNYKSYKQHFKLDKKQEAIDWLVAKRLELGILNENI